MADYYAALLAYEAELRVDGEAVAVREGRLEAGTSTTLRFAREFDDPGEYVVSAGGQRTTVSVGEDAASPGIDPTGLEDHPGLGAGIALVAVLLALAAAGRDNL